MIYSLIIICPFKILGRNFRLELFKLFIQLIIAPFGEIGFKNYMFGSWLTSMIIPLKDIYTVILFLNPSLWKSNTKASPSDLILLIISILPFIWRILQNIKRVVHKKSLFFRQVQNFIRYVISIGLVITAYFDLYTSIY